MHIKKKIISALSVCLCAVLLLSSSFVVVTESAESKNSQISTTKNSLIVEVLALPDGGDCSIIQYGDVQILVDSGEGTTDNWTYIKSKISSLLDDSDSLWDYIIFTHPDEDHIGNFGNIFNYFSYENNAAYSIGTIIDYEFEGDNSGFFGSKALNYRKDRKSICSSKNISYFSAASLSEQSSTKSFSLGNDCDLIILYNYYDNLENHTKNNTNNISVCFTVDYCNKKLLFTGDLEQAGENQLINNHGDLLRNVTFYKAGHHGSSTSNTTNFVDIIKPCYVAITSNPNSYLSDDVVNNFLKYTDYIYPSYVYYNNQDCLLFGTSTFGFKNDEVSVVTDNNQSAQTIKDAYIKVNGKTVNWFDTIVNDSSRALSNDLTVYTFDEGITSYSNCSLIKSGHIDILIDCGSTVTSSEKFIDSVNEYVVDGVIEYLIVTHFHTANITQLIENGILSSFKINYLIDSTVSNLPEDAENGFYKRYLDLATEENENIGELIRLRSDSLRSIVVTDNLNICLLSAASAQNEDEDDCSMSALIDYYGNKILFVGDSTDFDYISKKLDLSDIAYYRASQSSISYCDVQLREDYIAALEEMNAEYTVIGSAIGYRMPGGALFGSEQYQSILINYCEKVYFTGYINAHNEYKAVNGDLIFTIAYKPNLSDEQLYSMTSSKKTTPLKLSEKW